MYQSWLRIGLPSVFIVLSLALLLLLAHSLAAAQQYTIADLGADFTPVGINNLGQVAGNRYPGGDSRAFIWSAQGGMQDLDTPRSSYAVGINDRGEVVGSFDIMIDSCVDDPFPEQVVRGFVWTSVTGIRELGTLIFPSDPAYPLCFQDIFPTSVNNQGEIIGHYTTSAGECRGGSFIAHTSGGINFCNRSGSRKMLARVTISRVR